MTTKGTQIFSHAIDDASTVTVMVEGTAFEGQTGGHDDLQTCLELISEHATSDFPAQPIASETVSGMTMLSDEVSVIDSTNDTSAVTPAALDFWFNNHGLANEWQYGFVKLISQESIDNYAPTDNVEAATKHAFTLKMMNYVLDTKLYASESNAGAVRLANQAQSTTTGALSTSVAMTPLRVKQMLDVWANTTASAADETTVGLIRLANATEVNDDSIATQKLAISPYRFNSRTATTTRKAGFKLPSPTVADARTSNEHAVTVGTLHYFNATSSQVGVAKLANRLDINDSTMALSAAMGYKLNNDKIGDSGGTVSGVLKVNTIKSIGDVSLMSNGLIESRAMLNMYPIGAVYMSLSSTSPSTLFGGSWVSIAAGRVLISAGGSYAARSYGGEYAVTLTESTMPTHKHAGWGEHSSSLGWGVATKYGRNNIGSARTDRDNYLYYSEPKGGSQAHNNIQPYYTVYMWERTA